MVSEDYQYPPGGKGLGPGATEQRISVSRPPKLLIFGINYAPEETGIGPYTRDLAEHLVRRDWRVTVVTGMPHYPQWRVLPQYRRYARVRESRCSVDLRRVRHYTPRRQSAIGRVLYEATFLGQAVTQTELPTPDCVVGVVPSLGGGVAGRMWAQRYQVPFGIIFQDLMGRAAVQSGMPGAGLAARPARALEAWVARGADRIAVVADSFRPYLEQSGVDPERIIHIPNWSHVEAKANRATEVRHFLGWGSDEQVALHAGNIGYKQGLENLVVTARMALNQGLHCRFVLMGDGNERLRLEALADDLPNVQFMDPQPAGTFMDVLAAADVLIVNERPSVIDMSLPSKITTYFQAGRPVVAAVPVVGSTAELLNRSGGALVVPAGDPGALLGALCLVHENRVVERELVNRATAYAIEHFDMPTLLTRSERFVDDLLTASRSEP